MESYLRAIGFSNVCSKKQIDNLLGDVMTAPSFKKEKIFSNNEKYVELTKIYAKGIGLTICGYYDKKMFFHIDHYYPFVFNPDTSIREELFFNKQLDNIAYSCLCENIKIGIPMNFYLQNVAEYMEIKENKKEGIFSLPIKLSGLCKEAKVILPVVNSIEGKRKLKERIKNEDIYSIVYNSIYPIDINKDCYSIVGNIKSVICKKNFATNECLYSLSIQCKNVNISVIVNKNDIIGEPIIGCRFKGNIWLQGYVDFKNAKSTCV